MLQGSRPITSQSTFQSMKVSIECIVSVGMSSACIRACGFGERNPDDVPPSEIFPLSLGSFFSTRLAPSFTLFEALETSVRGSNKEPNATWIASYCFCRTILSSENAIDRNRSQRILSWKRTIQPTVYGRFIPSAFFRKDRILLVHVNDIERIRASFPILLRTSKASIVSCHAPLFDPSRFVSRASRRHRFVATQDHVSCNAIQA